jgi:STE24 endopeptidase
MNIYGTIILVALVFGYLLERVADRLNLRAASCALPEEFADVYEAGRYSRSQRYLRASTRLGAAAATAGLGTTLLIWLSGGFNLLDRLVRSWDVHPILTGLCFMAILAVAKGVLALPFSLCSTFVIEQRFGFNRTRPLTYVLDILKVLLLAVLLGGPILAVVLAFFRYAGPWAWLWCWAATTAFSLAIAYVAPTWIMPIFNRFEPLEEGELRSAILAYADRVGFPVEGIYVMDGSKRSTKSNAFFTGFGRTKRIVLFDTLIERHTTGELVGVLAHEIGHYKKRHVLKGLLLGIAHNGVMLYLLGLFLGRRGLFDAFYMDATSVYAGLVFFGLLYTPVELILSVALNWLSRRHEWQADRWAAETTGRPEAFAAALKRLSADNLSNLTPHPFYVWLEYSHPPILERVRALTA